MRLLIKNACLTTHEKRLEGHWLLCTNGKIEDFGPMDSCPDVGEVIDAKGMNVLPGAIEMHIHGADGVDAMDAGHGIYRKDFRTSPRDRVNFLPCHHNDCAD